MSKQFKFYSGAVCDKETYREKQRRRMEMNICCILSARHFVYFQTRHLLCVRFWAKHWGSSGD